MKTIIVTAAVCALSVSITSANEYTEIQKETCSKAYSQVAASTLVMGYLRNSCELQFDPTAPACASLIDHVLVETPKIEKAARAIISCTTDGTMVVPGVLDKLDMESGQTAATVNALTAIMTSAAPAPIE